MSKTFKKNWTPYLLVLPSVLIVLLFVIYPIINTVWLSLKQADGGLTLDHYLYFLTDPIQQGNILYTLQIVIVTVLITLVFSYLLALYLRYSTSKLSKLIGTLTLIPRFIPGLVAVYAMILVIRDSGVIHRIGLLFGYDWQPGMMYNAQGITMMNVWFNIPFATLIIYSALTGIQDSIIDSARDVGASSWQILKDMILPLSYRDALVAATFVFMGNVGSFTTPFLMGGNNPKMLGIVLYDQFNSHMNYERAAALSVLMFIICSLSAGVYIYTNIKESDWEKSR